MDARRASVVALPNCSPASRAWIEVEHRWREPGTAPSSAPPLRVARTVAPSFRTAAHAYLRHARGYMTPRSFESRRRLVNRQLVPYFKGLSLRGVDGPHIREYLDAMQGVAGATRNRHQTVLSCIFRYAREAGLADANPALRVRRAREGVFPITVMDSATQDRLLAGLPAHVRSFFMVLLDTGLRLGEALDLEWQDIDLVAGTLHVRRSKAKRPRLVGLPQRLRLELKALSAAAGGEPRGHVYRAARATHFTLRCSWRNAFKRAAAAIGYPRMRIHDLRHLHAVNLVRVGVDLPTVQTVLGHTTLISTLRYAEYADGSAARRAVGALDAMHARPAGGAPGEPASP